MPEPATDVRPAPPGDAGGPGATRSGSSRRRSLLWLAAGVALSLALVAVLVVRLGTGSGGTGQGSGLPAPAANLLRLDTLGPGSRTSAPDFTLTDQHGRRVSLSQFRGKVVVLSFNDDECPDLCTLLAEDIVVADRDLGPAASHVVFLSVNVNAFHPQVAAVRSWSASHGLGRVPNWHFTTGPVPMLESVWKHYGVYVRLDRATRTVQHGAELYFIDPAGRQVAVGQFGTNAADTSLYAHAMAQQAADLLPTSQQVAVGGPQVPAPTRTDAAVGAPSPPFSLPLLGHAGRLSSSDLKGHYAVLNFWASTCSACTREMPHVEQAYRDLGSSVRFVGVDVADQPGAATSFARRAGVTYPLVSDSQGRLSGGYRVPGLPFTAIVGPGGKVLVRHPGAMTTEQLEYLVKSEDAALGGS